MFFQILGAIAEFEHALMSDRTLEGLAAARARGRLGIIGVKEGGWDLNPPRDVGHVVDLVVVDDGLEQQAARDRELRDRIAFIVLSGVSPIAMEVGIVGANAPHDPSRSRSSVHDTRPENHMTVRPSSAPY